MCCHPGFVPFTKHMQSRYNSFFFFGLFLVPHPRHMEIHCLDLAWVWSLELLHALDTAKKKKKKVGLFFEALKPGICFSLAVKILGALFFPRKTVSSTLKIRCLWWPPSLVILVWITWVLLAHQHLLLQFCNFMLWRLASFLKPHSPTCASFIFLQLFNTSQPS